MLDSEIVALYWARNEDAISETAKKYGAYCRAIAQRILGNTQDAEESLNDTWMAAWASIPPHRPAALSTYLGKITRRLSLKKWRDGRAAKRGGGEVQLALDELAECMPDARGMDDALAERALAQSIDAFLAVLPDQERRVFVCRYWYLDSISEISGQFGFSQGKVKSMLRRTRQRLLAHLKEEGVFE